MKLIGLPFTLDTVEPGFDRALLEEMLHGYPGGMAPHSDTGSPASASWYHSWGTDGSYCTTIFSSDRRPTWAGPVGRRDASYSDPNDPDGVTVARGSLGYEPGVFRVFRSAGNAAKAPYER